MPSSYEIWLTDDRGRRFMSLTGWSFFSYSRTTKGLGTFEIGLPLKKVLEELTPYFRPDWRVEVWRSPDTNVPLRLEQTYLLRKPRIYTRQEDNMDIIVYYGHDLKNILGRRWVVQAAGTSYTRKEAPIDDIMKEIVREQMLYGSAVDVDGVVDNNRAWPQYEFYVQEDHSLGPTFPVTLAEQNVLDILKDLHSASRQLYLQNLTHKIYYDVVPVNIESLLSYILDEEDGMPILAEDGSYILEESSPEDVAVTGFQFRTYAGLYGVDRTANSLIFSKENNNIKDPYYSLDYFDEQNTIIVKGFGRGDSREWSEVQDDNAVNASRWNRCEGFRDASTEPDQDRLEDFAYSELYNNRAKEELTVTFLNVPEGPSTPRSLYGLDWDLGDLLPVFYAGKQFNIEVEVVYVAVNENSEETITGRSNVGASN